MELIARCCEACPPALRGVKANRHEHREITFGGGGHAQHPSELPDGGCGRRRGPRAWILAPVLLAPVLLAPMLLASCGARLDRSKQGAATGSRGPSAATSPRGAGNNPDGGCKPRVVSGAGGTTGASKVRFAVIGDFGNASAAEAKVAALVKGWNPDFVITTGDNNYSVGSADTIDANIGQYYQEFIGAYAGRYGCGASENRFFPSLGNHDWDTGNVKPYQDYFALPGNERYYELAFGNVHLFALDSDSREPDGVTADSLQAAWLRSRLAVSTAPWQIVYMHHPPYSSGPHLSTEWMRWPYKEWGADVVFAGHDHDYERLEIDGLPYMVNGLGGASLYPLGPRLPGSLAGYDANFGAILVEADASKLSSQFFTIEGQLIDQLSLSAPP